MLTKEDTITTHKAVLLTGYGYLGQVVVIDEAQVCTEVIFKHIFVGFIQNMVVFIKKSNKKLIFPT